MIRRIDEALRAQLRNDLTAKRRVLRAAQATLLAGRDDEAQGSVRRVARSIAGTEGGYPPLQAAAERLAAAPADALLDRLDDVLAAIGRVLSALGALPEDEGSVTVLVVESDPAVVEAIRRALASPARTLVMAGSAAAARLALAERTPDLIVQAIALPDADGRAFLGELRGDPRTARVPVCVLSRVKGAEVECLALGADAYFEKPVDEALLAVAAAHALRRGALTARQARRDPVTGVLNRAALLEDFARLSAQAAATSTPLAVALLDVDDLKGINARAGHSAGDRALRAVAQAATEGLRAADLVGRWGGDVFVALLPRTPIGEAERVTARVLEAARARAGEAPLGLSAGVVMWEPGRTLEATLDLGHRQLQEVKRAGGGGLLSGALAAPARPRTAALVGQDAGEVEAVSALLKAEGLTVQTFTSGAEALAQGARTRPALWVLARGRGDDAPLELLGRLRASGSADVAAAPVILVLPPGAEADQARALDLGADDYVVSPPEPATFGARVRRALRARSRGALGGGVQTPGELTAPFVGDQLLELVQMLGVSRRSGTLRITGSARAGCLVLDAGQVVGAQVGGAPDRAGADGHAAILDLLSLRHGRFDFVPDAPRPAEARPIEPVDVGSVLLEVMRSRVAVPA